jgi:hypothetical protein
MILSGGYKMNTEFIYRLPELLLPEHPLDVASCNIAQAQNQNILRYCGNFTQAAYTVTTAGNAGITYTGASTTAPLGAKHMLTLAYRLPTDPHHNTLNLMVNVAASVASRFNLLVYVFGGETPYILNSTMLQAQINNCIMSQALAVNNTTAQWLPITLDFSANKPSVFSIVLGAGAYTASSASLYLYGAQSSWGD